MHLYNEIKSLHKKFTSKSKVLIAGCTFKENCPDIRNSKILDLVYKLQKNKIEVDIYDNWVNIEDKRILNLNFLEQIPKKENYFYILIAVKHDIFKKFTIRKIKNMTINKNCIINDYKNILK